IQVTVTFSEPVQGVNVSDLLVNDEPATGVSGSGTTYTFTFAQPAYGGVQVNWSPTANITDFAAPPNLFDTSGANATFVYDLVDASIPVVIGTHPPANFPVRKLAQVEISFSKAVEGVDAADLLINGQPATNVVGFGSGPYVFDFPQPQHGPVTISWAVGNEIRDLTDAHNLLPTASWNYTVDSERTLPRVILNEISAANLNGLIDQDGSAED